MTKYGEYMVYRMYNAELDDKTTVFFLPDKHDFQRLLDRKLRLLDLKKHGYEVLAVAFVDKECYLNERLNVVVEEYCYVDGTEQDIKAKYRQKEVDYDTFWNTIQCVQDFKWSCLKRIDMLVRRCAREDFDVWNEIALQLVDQYRRCVV